MALKMGPDKFYQYIRAFGFGARSGIELPGETRGLLRPPKRWGSTSIGSLAIGQEVGVTPVQLVTMVSTIAQRRRVSASAHSAESTERSEPGEPAEAAAVPSGAASCPIRCPPARIA